MSEFHAEAPQATASEGLEQDPYVVDRVGFEPATLRTKGVESTNEPLRPTSTVDVVFYGQVLQWKMTPVTPISWTNVFLQAMSVDSAEEKEQFLYPQYNGQAFVQIARVSSILDYIIM